MVRNQGPNLITHHPQARVEVDVLEQDVGRAPHVDHISEEGGGDRRKRGEATWGEAGGETKETAGREERLDRR